VDYHIFSKMGLTYNLKKEQGLLQSPCPKTVHFFGGRSDEGI